MSRAPGEQRRSQIIVAARAVLARCGVEATTTREIAAEAGVRVGLLHYYFASKTEILSAVIHDTTAGLVTAIGTLSGPGADLERCVGDLLALGEPARAEQVGLRLSMLQLTVTLLRTPALAPIAEAKYAELTSAIATRLTACVAERPLDREAATQLARLLIALVDGITVLGPTLPAAERGALLANARRCALGVVGDLVAQD
ncbi:TetR/AcrR family transcriptional regulator [Goodfellowiella coeruleoviolacea]|uniref:Transcriptional regulator, TetR family n=1 Tax=Goodfellowiella coeruleoviolacea TaxID=334858 RepID=A0AAE3GCS7_9PSEU|nr:TetR/AcrR family transcriptional regulator [Goodfellowiella coeruleoviolacea]MCP2165030.1 transcriptional regulator, TetR family [Goodfellowiella coeruleoviolacea]